MAGMRCCSGEELRCDASWEKDPALFYENALSIPGGAPERRIKAFVNNVQRKNVNFL